MSTIQRKRALGGKGRICFLSLPVSLSLFHHAWRVVKDRVQAEGQQIDYPVCRKCVQGLCRQAGNKQRPLSVEALKHTRSNVIRKG